MTKIQQKIHDSRPSDLSHQPVVGVLLVHGLNGSRHDMAEVESALHAEGMVTTNMVLPGHDPDVREKVPIAWKEWTEAVSSELAALKQRSGTVFLVGHSLGGALALYTAAHEEVAGVVTMCAPLHLYPLVASLVHMIKTITPFLPVLREDVSDPQARRRYTQRAGTPRWVPVQPVESLFQFLPHVRATLPEVTVPALIMLAGRDHVVPARDSHEIYRTLGSQEKELVIFHRSSHVLMKDYDREKVYAKISAFIKHHAHTAGLQERSSLQ
jgi:carboxylesterase